MTLFTNQEALAMGILVAALATAYFALRLVIEARLGSFQRQLAADVRRPEARLRELEAIERARPFVPFSPTRN